MAQTYTLAIIAGGKSKRMGTTKALIKIGHQTIIERIISQTQSINWHKKIIITNTPDSYGFLGLPMYPDKIADSGALGGIYTALHHSTTPYTVVIACDMPFVSDKILKIMMTYTENYDAIVPVIGGREQGLHAIYTRKCLEVAQTQVKAGELRVRDFHKQINVNYLDESIFTPINSKIALMNVNTPDDLAYARQIALHQK